MGIIKTKMIIKLMIMISKLYNKQTILWDKVETKSIILKIPKEIYP